MFAKQLSVFIENRKRRLEQVTEVLKEKGINILPLSMADITEYGMLRMIVPDPEKTRSGLRERGLSAMLTDILAVKLESHVGELHKMTYTLCGQGLNTEYTCALAPASRRATIAKASDSETAVKVITDGGLILYNNEEMY